MKAIRRYVYQIIAKEISSVSKYFDLFVQYRPLATDDGLLFSLVQSPRKIQTNALEKIPELSVVLLNGNINFSLDIQKLLGDLHQKMHRDGRVLLLAYNSYLRHFFALLNFLGLRKAPLPTTFITNADLRAVAKLAGFEVTRVQPLVYFPFRLGFLGPLINGILRVVPAVRWTAIAAVAALRPVKPSQHRPSLSIIIPARNEAGNLTGLLDRLNGFDGVEREIIFVEGHSRDATWERIQQLVSQAPAGVAVKAFKQKGVGKKDAVALGMSQATKELLTILDADLTVAPELLSRFYQAYCEGHGDFINGSRLVYPGESGSMRFLNRLGNIFFAKALSFVLDVRVGDSLCGTKLFSKRHYDAIMRWNHDFGDVDPFGDFALLFPASGFGLGISDLPVRYLARTYGTTNIQRFRHGLMLLKMTGVGLLWLKMGSKSWKAA